jgi:DNA-binding transcriptional LysR family regulator
MINLGDYRIFYYIAQNGNITKTAQQLYMTQPALTKAVQRLETELGFTLFLRSQKGVELTSEGRELFNMISPPIEELIAVEKRIKSDRAHEAETVRVNAHYHFANVFMPDILIGFKEKYPNIEIAIECNPIEANDMEDSVDKYDIHIGFGTPESEEFCRRNKLDVQILQRVRDVMFVGEPLFSLADRELSLEEVADHPLIASAWDRWIRTTYAEIFARFGKELKLLNADGTTLRLALARQGSGILVSHEGNGEDEMRSGIIRKLTIREELPIREHVMYTQCDDKISPAAATLRDYIANWFKERNL